MKIPPKYKGCGKKFCHSLIISYLLKNAIFYFAQGASPSFTKSRTLCRCFSLLGVLLESLQLMKIAKTLKFGMLYGIIRLQERSY
ncbi:MAG: hypothetical protein J6R40_02640, partial [Clostridia bacterium]|nr:hypothetical protein [Clostridia bacterium]